MARHGKKYIEAAKKVDRDREYTPDDAIAVLKEIAFANFDEPIEVHASLGIDPRQADQAVRSNVVLPHGTGKVVRVLVFAQGEAERIANEAGADYAGGDDLVAQIQGGWLEFDAAVAMADMMGKVGGLGRILAWHRGCCRNILHAPAVAAHLAAHGQVALLLVCKNILQYFLGIAAIGVPVYHRRLTAFAAQQIIHRHIGNFALDVPQCHIHAADRVVQYRAVAPVGVDHHHMPQIVDIAGVAALQQRVEVIVDRFCH